MKKNGWIAICLLAGLAASGTPLHADCTPGTRVVILGIIEGPDPIGTVTWEVCGGGAGSSGDGRPDVTNDPVIGAPLVVWAYDNGSGHDIVFSAWDAEDWLPVETLDSSVEPAADPRVFTAGGAIYVVWWEPATGRILLTSRQPESTQWSPPRIVASGGRRPSVALWGGKVHIAYERTASWGGQEIVVQTRSADGTSIEVIAATTDRTDPLDPVLHVAKGKVWLDWKDSDTTFAYVRLAGGFWSGPTIVEWIDSSWQGEIDARDGIRSEVFAF